MEEKKQILIEAIKDTQETIRALDLKVSFLIAFIAVILSTMLYATKENPEFWFVISLTIPILLFIIAIWLLLLTLSPKSNPKEHLKCSCEDIPEDAFFYLSHLEKVKKWNFLKPTEGTIKFAVSLKEVEKKVNKANIKRVLIFELLKVSYIREIKLQRFRMATYLSFFGILIFIILSIINFL